MSQPSFTRRFFHPTRQLYWHALSHQFRSHFNARHHTHNVVLIVITLSVFLAAFFIARLFVVNSKILGDSDTSLLVVPPTSIPVLDAIENSVTTTAQPTPKTLVYSIELIPKTPSTPSSYLADNLIQVLNIPLQVGQPFPIKALAYDVRTATPSANSSGTYLAVIDTPTAINSNSRYETPSATFIISDAESVLLPFLLDRTYCHTNSDCSNRTSLCQNGAYNNYEPFIDSLVCLPPKQNQATSFASCLSSPTCQSNRCIQINQCNQ